MQWNINQLREFHPSTFNHRRQKKRRYSLFLLCFSPCFRSRRRIYLSTFLFHIVVLIKIYFLENTNQSNGIEKRKYSVQDIPRLPREVTPFATFYQFQELDQRGPFFKGPGAKYNSGRYRIRSSDEENVKRAKKFAMEQSVKHVLVKQQQQQQRQQMDVLKKQQALLLMCR